MTRDELVAAIKAGKDPWVPWRSLKGVVRGVLEIEDNSFMSGLPFPQRMKGKGDVWRWSTILTHINAKIKVRTKQQAKKARILKLQILANHPNTPPNEAEAARVALARLI